MEEKKIEAIKSWLEPKSVWDIQVFLGFANFYKRFTKNFSRITTLFTLMIWTTNELSRVVFPSTKAKDRKQNKKV